MLRVGKKIKEQHIQQVWTPPLAIAGRGIAIHIKNSYLDLLLVALYFPARPQRQTSIATYRCTCRKVADWANGIIKDAKGITSPCLFADVNDGVGLQQFRKGVYYDDDNTTCAVL